MYGNAWWGIYPPFEADDDWRKSIDRFMDGWTSAWPDKDVRYEIKLPELYTKDDLDKKYREGVAAGKAEMEEELAAEYDRGYEDALNEYARDDIDYFDQGSVHGHSNGYNEACENVSDFLKTIWNADGKTFKAIKDVYMKRNPDEDEDEVCIEDIMEDIINADDSIDEMMRQYGRPQYKLDAIHRNDLVEAPDGSHILIHSVDADTYTGFNLDNGKKVSGTLSSVKRYGRMTTELL